MNKFISKISRSYYNCFVNKESPVFIHIPKTGGTYIGQFENYGRPAFWPVEHLGHVAVVENEDHVSDYPPVGYSKQKTISAEKLKGRTVFSACRNIFSWLVSYAGHAGGWNPKYRDPAHYDFNNAKSFDYLLKTIANREKPWPSRKMIHFALFSRESNLIVDWICRTETLNQDLASLALHTGSKFTPTHRQRVGGHDDYRKFYTDNLVELVYSTWGAELDLFGYNFDGERPGRVILERKIDEISSLRVKYDVFKDQLRIDGIEIPKGTTDISVYI